MTALPISLIDANLVESIREFARWQKHGQLVERDGALFVAGTSRFPVVSNAAVRLDTRLGPGEFLDRAGEFFRDQGRGYTVWIRPEVDEDVEAEGLQRSYRLISSSPWMVLDGPLPEQAVPQGLEIREATSEEGVRDACRVNREAFTSLDMPASVVDEMYGCPHRALHPGVKILVGYTGGAPVSTAMLLFTPQVAGVYWVGTVEAVRGRGYAEAMTRAVSNAGFESGAPIVTLQASIMGRPIYERMGYRTVGHQKWLLSPKINSNTG